MGTDSAEALENGLNPDAIMVHSFICNQLMMLVDRIKMILPEIEAARPRCSSGIQALCLLSRAIERSNLLIHYCTYSSKLYLVITCNAIVSRFKKSRDLLQKSLIQIENMVPLTLAVKISHIIEELGNTEFVLGSIEGEAGRVMLALVQSNSSSLDAMEDHELYALKITTSLVRICTPRGVLTERRCIKKLIEKVDDHNSTKYKVLNYLLHLLNKYGRFLSTNNRGNSSDTDNNEEHSPSTVCMKHLPPRSPSISNGEASVTYDDCHWFTDLSDVSSMRSLDISYSPDCSHTKNMEGCDSSRGDEDRSLLSELSSLPWESRCKVVDQFYSRVLLASESFSCNSISNSVYPLLDFLNSARDRHDPVAQASALKLLLALMTHNWVEGGRIGGEGVGLLASFLESEFGELALDVIEAVCGHKDCRATVAGSGVLESMLKGINTGSGLAGKMVKVVRGLSWDSDARFLIADMGFVPALVRLMEYEEDGAGDGIDSDNSLIVKDCLVVIRNVCETEKGRERVGETEGCIAAVSRRLESEVEEEEENAVMVLLSLCSNGHSYCRLVMEEGVIPALVSMSVNGGEQGKAAARELLRILRDIDYSDTPVEESRGEDEKAITVEEVVGKVEAKGKKQRRKMGFFGRFWSPKATITVWV